MRPLVVYLIVLLLLTVSIVVGIIASDWPDWCRRFNWCAANWPPGH